LSAATGTQPDQHALVVPDCDCGTCAPTWARRRKKSQRFSDPVTLVEALAQEDAEAQAGMVRQHREHLAALIAATGDLITETSPDDPARPEAGMALVMFGAELATAVRPDEYREELPAELVAECEQTVTAAMLAAATCLSGLLETVQLLDGLMT
jgi:hypothetical protein